MAVSHGSRVMTFDLLRFKKIVIESKDEVILSSEDFLFQVVGIYCYLADAHYLSCLSSFFTPFGCEAVYLYDIIIADNQYKQKCLLHPKLSDLVQKNILQIGHRVKVNKVACLYYEVENSFPYIILTNIDIKDKKKIPVLSNLSFTSHHNKREILQIPLVTLREYYLNTWLMHIPYMSNQNSG
ncbi:RPA-related protein RADX-like [Centruroides vittatus]|uniref:RPA-related protein RADX-like n=1 Tax=Centruroides vittatus TaxID=120091 RepID=UPI00350FE4CC